MLREVVAEALPSAVFLEAQNFVEAEQLVSSSHSLDLALVDVALGGIEGLTGLLRLSVLRPNTPFIMVSARNTPDLIRRARVCGAA